MRLQWARRSNSMNELLVALRETRESNGDVDFHGSVVRQAPASVSRGCLAHVYVVSSVPT
jgi:hypothetical protein